MREIIVEATPAEVAREAEWARLISLVNTGDIDILEADSRFTEWVSDTGNH